MGYLVPMTILRNLLNFKPLINQYSQAIDYFKVSTLKFIAMDQLRILVLLSEY
jgi:hypothetical protein